MYLTYLERAPTHGTVCTQTTAYKLRYIVFGSFIQCSIAYPIIAFGHHSSSLEHKVILLLWHFGGSKGLPLVVALAIAYYSSHCECEARHDAQEARA